MRGVIDQEIAFRKDMQDRGATPRVLFHMETNVHITATLRRRVADHAATDQPAALSGREREGGASAKAQRAAP
jgi:hypothetical protein